MADQRLWSNSTAVPEEFEFWAGSGKAVRLPVHKDRFTKIVMSLGGKFYITGQGNAQSLSPPFPNDRSPCEMTSRAIVIDFDSTQAGETPGYVAYIDSSDMIVCIDKQFSYFG